MSRIGTRQDYHNTIGPDILGRENCPFCDVLATQNTLLHEFDTWKIILNKYPYSGQENHLMAVPKRHIAYSHELQIEELQELTKVYIYMKEFFENIGEKDYFSSTRETM